MIKPAVPALHKEASLQAEMGSEREGAVPRSTAARVVSVLPVDEASVFVGPGATVPPKYYPRDPGEWQGRLVELSAREPCNDFGACGRARACVEGVCGPCRTDDNCLTGEACVLNNCVPSHKVNCRSRTDCPTDSVCMLVDDGTASGWRGNAGLVAVCSRSEESKAIRRRNDAEVTGRKEPAAPDPVSMSGLAPALSKLVGRELRTAPVHPERRPDEE